MKKAEEKIQGQIQDLEKKAEPYVLHLILSAVCFVFMVIITGGLFIPIFTVCVILGSWGGARLYQAFKEHKAKVEARLRKKKMVMDELVATEGRYVKALEDLNTYYFDPLSQSGVVTPEQIRTIFGSFQVIVGYNRVLLGDFEKWSSGSSNMDEIFSGFTIKAHFLKCYIDYTNNFDHSTETIIRLKAESPKFAGLLNKQLLACGKPLESLLITPIQRIPRYILLLKELIKNTEPRSRDLPVLEKALTAVSNIAAQINACKKAAEDSEKILSLQNTLVGLSQDLISPGRVLVLDGPLTLYVLPPSTSSSTSDMTSSPAPDGDPRKGDAKDVVVKGEDVNVYLFSDLLIVSSGPNVRYELKLLNTSVKRLPDEQEFIRVSSASKRLKFGGCKQKVVDKWFDALTKAKKACDDRRRSLRVPTKIVL